MRILSPYILIQASLTFSLKVVDQICCQHLQTLTILVPKNAAKIK